MLRVFAIWLIVVRLSTNINGSPTHDAHELLKLCSASTQDCSGSKLGTWQDSTPVCNWTGVLCNTTTGEVNAVDLSQRDIRGSLPTSWGLNGTFQSLQTLVLSGNSLGSSFPAEWAAAGAFPALRNLDLSNNSLTGKLPADYSSNTSAFRVLEVLSLDVNQLTGQLPTQWGAAGQQGVESVGPFHALQILGLSFNNLTGPLPEQWGLTGHWPSLKHLDLFGNKLTGTLPASWASMRTLEGLALGENLIKGPLPASWGKAGALPQLRYLLLSANGLTGSIPNDWSSLPALRYLDLMDNQLSRSVPASWGERDGGLPALRWLYLGDNRLTGSVPVGLLDGTRSLAGLDFQGNRALSGTLPATLGSDFFWLGLSNMHLTGTLPQQLPPHATIVQLEGNAFQGTLPATWSSSQLQYFAISVRGLGAVPISWYDGTAFPNVLSIDLGADFEKGTQSKAWRAAVCLNASLYSADQLRQFWEKYAAYFSNAQQVYQDFASQPDSAPIEAFLIIPYVALHQVKKSIAKSLEKVTQRSRAGIRNMCQNAHVPLVLGLMWGVLAGLVALMYVAFLLYGCLKTPGQTAEGAAGEATSSLKKGANADDIEMSRWKGLGSYGKSVLSVVVYLYDLTTDFVVIVEVWGYWPGYVLLALLLLQFLTCSAILCHQLKLPLAARAMGTLLLLVFTPLIDTLALLGKALLGVKLPEDRISLVLRTEGYLYTRDVVKAVTSSLPTALVTSVAYRMGNQPGVGLILTNKAFALSVGGAFAQVLHTWAAVLWAAAAAGGGRGSVVRELRSVFVGRSLRMVAHGQGGPRTTLEAGDVLEGSGNSSDHMETAGSNKPPT